VAALRETFALNEQVQRVLSHLAAQGERIAEMERERTMLITANVEKDEEHGRKESLWLADQLAIFAALDMVDAHLNDEATLDDAANRIDALTEKARAVCDLWDQYVGVPPSMNDYWQGLFRERMDPLRALLPSPPLSDQCRIFGPTPCSQPRGHDGECDPEPESACPTPEERAEEAFKFAGGDDETLSHVRQVVANHIRAAAVDARREGGAQGRKQLAAEILDRWDELIHDDLREWVAELIEGAAP